VVGGGGERRGGEKENRIMKEVAGGKGGQGGKGAMAVLQGFPQLAVLLHNS